jgi:ATP-dependent Clp protease ATP-binding subunit ClpX
VVLGKTLSIVNYLLILRKRYPKLKIYTNFYFSEGDGLIKDWSDLINITNYEEIEIDEKEYNRLKFLKPKKDGKDFYIRDSKYYKIINHGVVFGFDEIHMTLASDNWKSRPDDLLYYISQQRKMHKQIIASSQVFTRIDKTLREQTNFVVECNSYLLGRLCSNKYYHTEEYIANDEKKDKGSRKRKISKYRIFIAKDYIRNAYDTEEIMKDLKVGKSEQSQVLDLLVKLSNNR